MLVTFERLVAIKFTIHYPFINHRKEHQDMCLRLLGHCVEYMGSKVYNELCGTVFIDCCIAILCNLYYNFQRDFYRETLRHKKRIKAQLYE